MKRILFTILAVCLLAEGAIFGAVSANAGKIVSYNNSYGQQPRFISPPLLNGTYSQVVKVDREFKVFFEDGCIRWLFITVTYTRARTYVMGSLTVDETTASEPVEQVLAEFCP